MFNKYYTTIGLEIHVELKTKSKMFCGCLNDGLEIKPNINICPICMAHPGTLPVPNKKAIENIIKVGLALGGKISDFTEFDRKNYFYPDIPKGYQISQYKHPIITGGKLKEVSITRIHLEEDSATSNHDQGDYSLINFNRAGIPLMELVTEPVIHSAKEASDFARELQLLLRYLDVSDANMENGQMRVELNISISKDFNKLGTKVEIKNINSFKSVERAALYEINRMTSLLESNKEEDIVQETRGWNDSKNMTYSMRSKENAHDYRYFPEPDIPKLFLHKLFDIDDLKNKLPKLPEEIRNEFRDKYNLKSEDIEVFITNREMGQWFLVLAEQLNDNLKIQLASNYITSDYLGLKKTFAEIRLPKVENFVELINMVVNKEITSRGAKDILSIITLEDTSPIKIAKEKNLIQNNNESDLKNISKKIIEANPDIVANYKSGKENVIMFLVGQVMKETKGSANPTLVQQLLKELIK
jgi:aspartyl-tRNA(Asn)/glutamyl-tRNA(Gln) amidotransferase subunit B